MQPQRLTHTDVSVPLRGKGRDQRWKQPVNGCGQRLCGVSVPLRGKGRDQHIYLPNPPKRFQITVSVPLRGKGRDQLHMNFLAKAWDIEVSVPLRGKGRDQLYARPSSAHSEPCHPRFRPLAGKR